MFFSPPLSVEKKYILTMINDRNRAGSLTLRLGVTCRKVRLDRLSLHVLHDDAATLDVDIVEAGRRNAKPFRFENASHLLVLPPRTTRHTDKTLAELDGGGVDHRKARCSCTDRTADSRLEVSLASSSGCR